MKNLIIALLTLTSLTACNSGGGGEQYNNQKNNSNTTTKVVSSQPLSQSLQSTGQPNSVYIYNALNYEIKIKSGGSDWTSSFSSLTLPCDNTGRIGFDSGGAIEAWLQGFNIYDDSGDKIENFEIMSRHNINNAKINYYPSDADENSDYAWSGESSKAHLLIGFNEGAPLDDNFTLDNTQSLVLLSDNETYARVQADILATLANVRNGSLDDLQDYAIKNFGQDCQDGYIVAWYFNKIMSDVPSKYISDISRAKQSTAMWNIIDACVGALNALAPGPGNSSTAEKVTQSFIILVQTAMSRPSTDSIKPNGSYRHSGVSFDQQSFILSGNQPDRNGQETYSSLNILSCMAPGFTGFIENDNGSLVCSR